MPNEVLTGLDISDGGTYLDCTLGGGGHSRKILERSAPGGRLIAIDKDPEAIAYNSSLKKDFSDRVTIVHDSYENVSAVLDKLGIDKIDGALLDLGISSHQIDTPERGFSYMADAPLDMRMDTTQNLTAFEVVNTYPEARLADIIYRYGEESFSRRIAARIVEQRKINVIRTTAELAAIVRSCIPAAVSAKSGHPAKKTFQAIRIEVNNELTDLGAVLETLVERLKPGGRLAVITFHSLEDRIVKQTFKQLATDCICDKNMPICVCNHRAEIKLINNHPITAAEEELICNGRAKSAKLRIAEKTKV